MYDTEFDIKFTREKQLRDHFNIQEIPVQCNEEYLKIPLDLPWKELERDIPAAFDEYGWYGMVHRARSDWTRSQLYGGLGLNYNPNYKFAIPYHAHGLGQPRSEEDSFDTWSEDVSEQNYSKSSGLNTYDDCLGLHTPTPVSSFRSIKSIFDLLKVQTFQGRIAEVRAEQMGSQVTEDMKEFIWHTDERNEIISRILIPIIYDEDYWLEFKDTGTRIDFEPGYAYHFNTYKVHRWNFNYHENIKNRTCIVLGFSPWLEFDGKKWSTNKHFMKKHPTDMVNEGFVI